MNRFPKALAILPMVALVAACNATTGASDGLDSTEQLEEIVDQDIDGDGTVIDNGIVEAAED